jgi:hypothetical protein
MIAIHKLGRVRDHIEHYAFDVDNALSVAIVAHRQNLKKSVQMRLISAFSPKKNKSIDQMFGYLAKMLRHGNHVIQKNMDSKRLNSETGLMIRKGISHTGLQVIIDYPKNSIPFLTSLR